MGDQTFYFYLPDFAFFVSFLLKKASRNQLFGQQIPSRLDSIEGLEVECFLGARGRMDLFDALVPVSRLAVLVHECQH
jgi:hypothetical protein